MTNPLTINQVLDRLAALDGQPVEIDGILWADDQGGYALMHYPKSERQPRFFNGGSDYPPDIWIAFGAGSLQPNLAALKRWEGKRVRIHGLLRSVQNLPQFGDLGKGGFGPWGAWPAEIEPYILQRVSADERRQAVPQ
ncbi:hypothetical protein F2P45_24970 [Massilia sp. CCM 8733]|uniref:Uncharacterized protein n=1 Tax=Massilia mucilaginosa TaxID=2609282 RepID=A0ABX0P072_9BURK|nr:hypothetical protein [Massilia mucilaginosa]NHZ92231.1 hypothetical protein [Massilia mucilaginosa]